MSETHPHAEQQDHYLPGGCPVCGRNRLLFWLDGERLVGVECEQCHGAWRLGEDNSTPANPHDAWPHPITGEDR